MTILGRSLGPVLLLALATNFVAPQKALSDTWYVFGNELYRDCTDSNQLDLQMFCLGYIAGVALGQARDVVSKWLSENPKDRHLLAANNVLRALRDAFPC
ncbi:MAG: hypothetical protein L0210_12175 [Rhodospirillales bacterium]|nr:hypothetical protein [Rhodospirillales bacterium]